MRIISTLLALTLAVTLGWTQAADTAAVKAVRTTLDTIVPGEYRTYHAAEDVLAKADTNALNQVYREEYAALQAIQTQENQSVRLRARVNVMDGAMTRQVWQFAPQQKIREQLVKLGYNWTGYAERISDAQLFPIFPNHQFFRAATLPQGNDDRTRPFLHVFAVDREARLTHFTKPEDLKAFFLAHYDKTRAEKESILDRTGKLIKLGGSKERPMQYAVYSWLRLTSEFPPAIAMTIDEKAITVEMAAAGGGKPQTVATGKMVAAPKAPLWGSITVFITFDDTGKLTAIEEKRALQGPPPTCG